MKTKNSALAQKEFAQAIGISVYTLRNWEQGRRKPEGLVLVPDVNYNYPPATIIFPQVKQM